MKDSGNTTVAKKNVCFFFIWYQINFSNKIIIIIYLCGYFYCFNLVIWSMINKKKSPANHNDGNKKKFKFFFYWSLLLSSFWQFVAIPQFSIYWIFKNFQFSISTCYTDTHTLIIIYWSKLIVCFLFSVSKKKEFFHSHFSTNKQNLKKNCLERKSFYLFNTEN